MAGLAGMVAACSTNPPQDAERRSAAVPVGAVVESTVVQPTGGEGSFRVEVVSIQCDWYVCRVSTSITNTGTETASFPCTDLAAVDSTGKVFRGSWGSFGSSVFGCRTPTLQPGETASVPIDLGPSVHDRQLVTLIVPGADQQIDLPEVNR